MEVGSHVRQAMKDEVVAPVLKGRHSQVEFAPIPSVSWGLAAVHDTEKEHRKLNMVRLEVFIAELLIGLIAVLSIAFGVVNPMVRSIKEAVEFARAVGDGDVSGSLLAHSEDEIGELARTLSATGEKLRTKIDAVHRISRKDLSVEVHPDSSKDALGLALQQMVANLRDVIGQAGQGATETERTAESFHRLSVEVAGAAEETSAQSDSLAKAADSVHRNVQSVAAGTEEMGASIRDIAQSASQASRAATEALDRTNSANALVGKLGEASNEIGEVVEVIRGIAEQTNLLALNATIEAARAGEAGKGFAVVAGEVKELSKATSEATEGISTRIKAIQGEMVQAVSSIQEIADVIRKVSDLSHTMAAAVEEQTAATSEISRSIAEASRGVGEINGGLRQAAEAAGATARSAAEIQGGAERLQRSSSDLSAAVNAFQLT